MPIAVALWVGCTEPPRDSLRFIEEDPPSVFRPKNLADAVSVFRWTFQRPEDLTPWQCASIDDECRVADKVLRFRSSSPYPMLVREVDLDAHQIHAVRVTASGSSEETMRFFWTGPGEIFADERRIDLVPIGNVGKLMTYEGFMASHPRWRGRISQVRLDPNPPSAQPIEIGAIEGIRYEVGVNRILEEVDRAWKVDIDNDVRNVLLAPPGHSIEREVLLPPEAELRFGLGLVPGVRLVSEGAPGDTRFRILLRGSEPDPVTLFDRTVQLAEGREGPGWREHVVDLSAYAGKGVRLVLETSAREASGGIPVWAAPEIVPRHPSSAAPNVVLISIDTLRADHLSLNGYSRPTSPRIDAWARRVGVNFRDAIAPAPWTLPSHVSLFTGQDTIRHGANHNFPVPASLSLLSERLREAGYKTLAVTGGGLLRPEYGFAQGFDSYRYWPDRELEEDELQRGIERALAQVERHTDRPFFLFFHTYEVHSPYRAREPFYGRFETLRLEDPGGQIRHQPNDPSPEDGMRRRQEFMWRSTPTSAPEPLPAELLPVLVTLYDSAIAYTDGLLGRLLDRLGEPDLAERTIVVLTSDHGESLGEQGRAAHYHLYDENLRVPLIVAYPGILPGGRAIDQQVRIVDILPTILDLAGLDIPAEVDGESLRAFIGDEGGAPPREAWSYSARTNLGISLRVGGTHKYIFNNSPWPPFGGNEELYHLEDDPLERRNLAARKPGVARSLRDRVKRTLSEVSGVWLRFSNEGKGSYYGELQGNVDDRQIKSIDAPAGALRWTSESGALFSVPPGVSFTIMLDEPVPAAVRVVGAWRPGNEGDELPFHWNIETGTLSAPRALVLESAGWIERDEDSGQGTGITAWRQGGKPGESPSMPLTMDESDTLRRELEALGYLGQ